MPTEPLSLPPAEDALYAGHFPGRPLIPGVLLLDAALRAIARATAVAPPGWELAQIKFLVPTAPGAALHVVHETLADASLRFSIRTGHAEVARGVLRRAPDVTGRMP